LGYLSFSRAGAELLVFDTTGIMARRAEKQFRKDFERLKKLLES